jgi:heme/copper-type cytochrome/quinol oxidase subunit 3
MNARSEGTGLAIASQSACFRCVSIAVASVLVLIFFVASRAGNADGITQSAPISISSVQGPEFALISQNKILLVVSPDFFKLAMKLFQKENIPNSAVVIAADMPSKMAAVFVDGQKFEFQDTTDNTFIGDFEHQKLAVVMVRLKAHLEERRKVAP